MRAGLPLEESLLAVSQQTEKPRVQSIVLGVRSRVMEGHTLADGLAEFPRVFPEIYRATVSAGEQSGQLDDILERLADYTEGREQMRQKVLGAPCSTPSCCRSCASPSSPACWCTSCRRWSRFSSRPRRKLPLVHARAHRHQRFPARLGHLPAHRADHRRRSCSGAGCAIPPTGARWHRLQLRLPLVGKLIRGFNTARFTRTFSILSASSVPVLEALRIAGEVVTNLPMRDAVTDAAAAGARRRADRPLARGRASCFRR